jgi:hypothetical protein
MVTNSLTNENYRYERKFFISALTKQEVESIVKLHPAMFSEIYQQRFVNNLYFDSFGMNSYFDNVNGSMSRVKFRIRWYDDLFGFVKKPVLELKIKNGLLGRKVSFPLNSFSISEDNFDLDVILDAVKNSDVPDALKLKFSSLEPSLLNRYNRKYYLSADGNYRITIDAEMICYQVNAHNQSLSQKFLDKTNTVLELKYNQDKDYYADQITNYFPFRLTKSSKYVSGVEKLYRW